MKKKDIDKKIGMPDVDAEWRKFEREVINQKPQTRIGRIVAWATGIGVAASVALLIILNMTNEHKEYTPLVAQQVMHHDTVLLSSDLKTKEKSPARNTMELKSAEPSSSDGSSVMRLENISQAEDSIRDKSNQTGEELQGHIAGLTIVPSSASSGSSAMRLGGRQDRSTDTILVVINGQQMSEPLNELILQTSDINQYFFDRHQFVKDINVWKEEAKKQKYGQKAKNGVLEINTMPFTPVTQLSSDQLKVRRLTYLQNLYRKGFSDDANRECFATDLYESTIEERLFGLLTQQYGMIRREYFGPVSSDAHGVYVPLIREACIEDAVPAWLGKNGEIVVEEDSPRPRKTIGEIDQAAAQADKKIVRTDSVVRTAFIYGGTVVETEPRPLLSDIWRLAHRYVKNTTFRFLPDEDTSSSWWGEAYSIQNQKRRCVGIHLCSVDKLYAVDCPEILSNCRKVEGTVLDEQGEPLTDASISIGRVRAADVVNVTTDSTGHFKITLPFRNAAIMVSHVGYRNCYIQSADTPLTIRLKSAMQLKDIRLKAIDISKYSGL